MLRRFRILCIALISLSACYLDAPEAVCKHRNKEYREQVILPLYAICSGNPTKQCMNTLTFLEIDYTGRADYCGSDLGISPLISKDGEPFP